MENQGWLKNSHAAGAGHALISALSWYCFFPTLLTRREVVVLEDAYISSQRNHLEKQPTNALDKHCSITSTN